MDDLAIALALMARSHLQIFKMFLYLPVAVLVLMCLFLGNKYSYQKVNYIFITGIMDSKQPEIV